MLFDIKSNLVMFLHLLSQTGFLALSVVSAFSTFFDRDFSPSTNSRRASCQLLAKVWLLTEPLDSIKCKQSCLRLNVHTVLCSLSITSG